jgi:aryl-alcohol dehydrogenase-like predicted oxidoreductase
MTGKMTKGEAEQIFDAYVSRGGNFVDTALCYQDGESVEWLGEWLAKRGCREQLVLAAKYSLPLKCGDINAAGNHRKSLFHAVDETLRHLRTTYLDLLYVHVWDFTTPITELLRALDDLVRLGKVHYLGVSDTPAWQVARANTAATIRGWTPFTCYQGKYSPAERDAETEILPMCMDMGLGFMPWGILDWCSRYGRDPPEPPKAEDEHAAKVDATVMKLATEVGRTPAQVVVNWAINKCGITSAVLTCHCVADLEEAIGGIEFSLTPDQIDRLDQVTRFVPTYPYNYIGYSYQSSPWFKSAGEIAPPH